MKTPHSESFPRIIFFDRLSFASLACILRYGRSAEIIWFFSGEGRTKLRLLLKSACCIGLIRSRIHYINQHAIYHRVRDNYSGPGSFVRVLADERGVRWKIQREQIRINPLVQAIQSKWPIDRIMVYFDRVVHNDLRMHFWLVHLVKQTLNDDLYVDPSETLFFIQDNQWFSYLYDYACSKDINLARYGHSQILWQYVYSLTGMILLVVKALYRRLVRLVVRSQSRPSVSTASMQGGNYAQTEIVSRIAIAYRGGELSFDPTERSALFWVTAAGIPMNKILVYGYMYAPRDNTVLKDIAAQGIPVFMHNRGPLAWQSTDLMDDTYLQVVGKLVLGIVRCLRRGQRVSLYHIHHLLHLARQYAYWYDFYATNRLCVDVDATYSPGGSVIAAAKIMAMEAWQGVSVNYQYALGYNILTLQPNVNTGEDVQFVFSRWLEQTWRSIGAPCRSYVHAGYLYDTAFQELRESDRVQATRQQLHSHGAQFILCYLDELSNAEEYEPFLRWVLEDPMIGVIFKPKHPESLFRRIEQISDLVEQAQTTGRCIFLSHTAGGRSKVFPAEAALMADVCIGMLLGTTAALEARLAGVPTILIDKHRMYNHPFYLWGTDQVVFDNWDKLRATVERYRADPQAYPEFGDWSPALNDLDPFQDGQASVRIGQYIGWVYDALNQGASKQAALEIAARTYAAQWGKQHITMNDQSGKVPLQV